MQQLDGWLTRLLQLILVNPHFMHMEKRILTQQMKHRNFLHITLMPVQIELKQSISKFTILLLLQELIKQKVLEFQNFQNKKKNFLQKRHLKETSCIQRLLKNKLRKLKNHLEKVKFLLISEGLFSQLMDSKLVKKISKTRKTREHHQKIFKVSIKDNWAQAKVGVIAHLQTN